MIITSVPHCGTHFAKQLFKGHEYNLSHTYPDQMERIVRLATEGPCIIPMRHPLSVALSWKQRGKDPNDAMPFWGRLIYQLDPLNPFYLPLDLDDRDAWLYALNDGLDMYLVTDWEIVRGAEPRDQNVFLESPEIARVEQMIETYAEFFGQFGYGSAT